MRHSIVVTLSAALLLGACSGDDTDPALDAGSSGTAPAATALRTSGPRPATTGAATGPAAEVGTEAVTPGQQLELAADLSGEAAYPGPGDEGSGTFTGTLTAVDEATGQLCYELRVRGLSTSVAAVYVHRGGAGEAGEVVVPLREPVDGRGQACVEVAPVDTARILSDPSMYYVNVHTDDYPDGAVRGQLAPAG